MGEMKSVQMLRFTPTSKSTCMQRQVDAIPRCAASEQRANDGDALPTELQALADNRVSICVLDCSSRSIANVLSCVCAWYEKSNIYGLRWKIF